MKKILIIGLVALVAVAAFGAQRTVTERDVTLPRLLRDAINLNATDAQTRLVALEAGSLSGNLTVVGNATIGGLMVTTPPASVNVTNGQAVTLSSTINLLASSGSENTVTNTVTLANPGIAGRWAVIYNSDAATNVLAVAKTGNYVGPGFELAAGESILVFAVATNKWSGLSLVAPE